MARQLPRKALDAAKRIIMDPDKWVEPPPQLKGQFNMTDPRYTWFEIGRDGDLNTQQAISFLLPNAVVERAGSNEVKIWVESSDLANFRAGGINLP